MHWAGFLKSRSLDVKVKNGNISREEYDRLVVKNKELTCLYGIARIILDSELPLDDKLQAIPKLLGSAFQFPERATAHIRLDGFSYQTPNFEISKHRLSEKVIVQGKARGCVEVGYLESDDSGPRPQPIFLVKEKQLLKTVARQLAFKVEKRELKDQLMHADRLATIGQLAAGIAHELNNPLTDILGFAQLASNRPDLPEETYRDLVKIVKSTLYAREVIKKILLFGRQSLPRETEADLNAIIEQWLDFIEFRCSKSGIEVVLDLDPELPRISADPGQLSQVLVNLVINAIHAMPDGGRLTVHTGVKARTLVFSVRDTGVGIKKELLDKIFMPFFTTKEVNLGTGLGLSVVYGIVREHGGTVTVKSREAEGSTFEIILPIKPNIRRDRLEN
jgi:signal transduction histidine kinase